MKKAREFQLEYYERTAVLLHNYKPIDRRLEAAKYILLLILVNIFYLFDYRLTFVLNV